MATNYSNQEKIYSNSEKMQGVSFFNVFPNFKTKEEALAYLQKFPEEDLKFIIDQGLYELYKSKLTPEAGGEEEISHITDEELEKPLPPMDWIIKDVMPRGTVGLLVADGGVGKSFFLLNLGIWLSTGLEEAPLKPPKPLRVLYLNAEDPKEILIRRLKRLKEYYEKIWHLRKDRFFVIPLKANTKPLAEYDYSGNPKEAEGFKTLEKLIIRYKPDIVFLDTLSRFNGLNENNSDDSAFWIQLLERLTDTYKLSFLIAHHIRKSSTSSPPEKTSTRGSSVWVDNTRLTLTLERPEPDLLKLSFIKNNYAPLKDPIFFKDRKGVFLFYDNLQLIVNALPEAFEEIKANKNGIKATARSLEREKKYEKFRKKLCELTSLTFNQIKPYFKEALQIASEKGLIQCYKERKGKRTFVYYTCGEEDEEDIPF